MLFLYCICCSYQASCSFFWVSSRNYWKQGLSVVATFCLPFWHGFFWNSETTWSSFSLMSSSSSKRSAILSKSSIDWANATVTMSIGTKLIIGMSRSAKLRSWLLSSNLFKPTSLILRLKDWVRSKKHLLILVRSIKVKSSTLNVEEKTVGLGILRRLWQTVKEFIEGMVSFTWKQNINAHDVKTCQLFMDCI